jgi:hypothetical protein
MAWGHAEQVLAAIRLLEAETAELPGSLPQLDDEQSRWLARARRPRRPISGYPAMG